MGIRFKQVKTATPQVYLIQVYLRPKHALMGQQAELCEYRTERPI